MFDNAQSARIAGVDAGLVPALAALIAVHVFQEAQPASRKSETQTTACFRFMGMALKLCS